MANTHNQFLLVSVCILVTQTTNGAFAAITKGPLNLVVYEGATNTTLTCENDDYYLAFSMIPFTYTGYSNAYFVAINDYLIPPYNEFFAVDHVQGTHSYTLVIFNATISPTDGLHFSTAGMCGCFGNYGYGKVHHMVVVRSDPICSASLTETDDVIQLSCTIVYGSGRDSPIDAIMAWSVNGEPIPAENANFTITSTPREVTASSTLLIDDNFEAIYECETTFSPPHKPHYGLAINAPDYSKTCIISHETNL